ncbi:peptidase S8/S53 domain-containing protein, partial [Fusarium sp. MPI-SDFR-AT-0072]
CRQEGVGYHLKKNILEPLYDRLADSFEKLTPLFDDMFGPGRSLAPPVSKLLGVAEKPILFDDEDATPSEKDQQESKKFLNNLWPLFRYIKHIRPLKPQIAQKQHPRIRIAVLDSGVNEGISLICQAIKTNHINSLKSKSFVGRESNWRQDSDGHGSHIVQLLLKVAPMAEIYVGKICTGKTIEPGYMKGIAEAIDWATDECDVDIISISIAYEEDGALIDAALAKAIHRDKQILAAASNNGGLGGRARPAHREGMHPEAGTRWQGLFDDS